MKRGLCRNKYYPQILLFLDKNDEVVQSRFQELSGGYNEIKNSLSELVDQGFIIKREFKYGGVKGVYSLTEKGEILADELNRIDEMYYDLRENDEDDP